MFDLTGQNMGAMADGQLPAVGDHLSCRIHGPVVRVQGAGGYLRPLHGSRSDVREDGRHHRQGDVPVRSMHSHCDSLSSIRPSSAYPQSGIFAACKPDVPCITPGTYAFLGAAAALR